MDENAWLKNIVKGLYKDVKDVKLSEPEGTGSSALSVTERIIADITLLSGSKKILSLIWKKIKKGGNLDRKTTLFNSELMIYRNVFPVMHEIVRTSEDKDILWPICYGYVEDTMQFALQDLKDLEYGPAVSELNLDGNHALITLICLGRFHALSLLCMDQLMELDIPRYSPFSDRNKPLIVAEFTHGLKTLSWVVINTWGPEWKTIGESIERISENICDLIHTASENTLGRYNVLNHGDMWSNNILYKYNEGKVPQSVKFVDFQLSFINSFCWDLCYFIYLNIDETYRIPNMRKLMETYHEAFKAVIDERGGSANLIPSLDEIQEMMDSILHFALVLSCVTYVEVKWAQNDDYSKYFSPEKMSSFYNVEWYSSPEMKEKLSKELSYFSSKNLFNT